MSAKQLSGIDTDSPGKSPWRNAKPRPPLSSFNEEHSQSLTEGENILNSPPNMHYRESTRMGTSLTTSPASTSLDKSRDKSYKAKLDMSSKEILSNSKIKEAVLPSGSKSNEIKTKTNSQSYTQVIKRSKGSKKNQSLVSEDEDDQPSGSCKYVGDSRSHISNISAMSGSTVNELTVNGSHYSVKSASKSSAGRTFKDDKEEGLSLEEPIKTTNTRIVIGVIVATFAILGFAFHSHPQGHPDPLFHSSQGSTEHWKVAKEVFGRRLKELRVSVPNQTKDTWMKISASLKSPLSPSPSYPGVLLLYSSHPDSPTSTCLASKLLSMSSEALKGAAPSLPMAQLLIAPSSLPKDPHQAKEALYSHLDNVISNTGVAGIFALESLEAVAALVLHAFADDTNAPFKQAVILATVHNTGEKEWAGKPDKVVEQLLRDSWVPSLGEDKVGAILSRILVNVVQIKEESKELIKSLCPEL